MFERKPFRTLTKPRWIFRRNYSTRSSVTCLQMADGRCRVAHWSLNPGYTPAEDSFSPISISTPTRISCSWAGTIPPTNTGLLHCIRSLTYSVLRARGPSRHPSVYTLQDYLPTLCNLQTLTFSYMRIEPTIPERLDLFSAFRHALLSLSLTTVSISWSAFASLVGYFPYLRSLEICWTHFRVDGQPVHYPSRPLHGRLLVGHMWEHPVDLVVDRFPELKLECEELVLDGGDGDQFCLFNVVQKSVRSLTIDWYEPTLLVPPSSDSQNRVAAAGPGVDRKHP
jgi:hypothetical protein